MFGHRQIGQKVLSEEARKSMRRRGMPEWAREIVERMAAEHSERIDYVAGRSRRFKAVVARQKAVYLIKEAKPKLSATQIGKWFDRDHTTILHAIACHQEANGLPRLSFYRLDRVRARNRHHAARQRAAMGRTLKQAR